MTHDIPDTLYAWLRDCAEAAEPCPTNVEIAARFGLKSVSSAANAVKRLEKEGRIAVARTRNTRTVTITETGARTLEMEPAGPLGRRRKATIAQRQALAMAHARRRDGEDGYNGDIGRYPEPPLGRSKTCQWIEHDPAPDDSCKCGAAVVEGWPYCYEHLERADGKPGGAG